MADEKIGLAMEVCQGQPLDADVHLALKSVRKGQVAPPHWVIRQWMENHASDLNAKLVAIGWTLESGKVG